MTFISKKFLDLEFQLHNFLNIIGTELEINRIILKYILKNLWKY